MDAVNESDLTVEKSLQPYRGQVGFVEWYTRSSHCSAGYPHGAGWCKSSAVKRLRSPYGSVLSSG